MPTARIPLVEKICSKCRILQSAALFAKRASVPSGLQSHCMECARTYREMNRERILASAKAYRQANKAAIAKGIMEWTRNNRDKVLAKNRRHEAKRKDKRNADNRALRLSGTDVFKKRAAIWRNSNREKFRAIHRYHSAMRKVLLRGQKIAAFYKNDTARVYKECPKGLHVDHIVPLKGDGVCGLHVPWNLQYLSPTDNRRKGNRYANS